LKSFQASNQSTLTTAASVQIIIPPAGKESNLNRSLNSGRERIRRRLEIVPTNTHVIALLGVLIVDMIVSDQDRFVRIRSRFARTIVVKVMVRTSSSERLADRA
jgi:hypothetical protein